jgi:hypothetical protein
MMDYLSSLFGGGNAAGGMRMPQIGEGYDLYGGQPSMNLGMTMPSNPYVGDMGTGMKPPDFFGKMPDSFSMDKLNMAKTLLDASQPKVEKMPAQMQPMQLPSGANQNYDQLLKMYGIRGLLG